ncbi:uncharacterized protein K452DRAFT_307241 [Aplosporella prunicola CBS 121167]|uniref:Uncharacterized protein n=1 Tax=Aplosporella prunicola CBS 121167 TaxID=1176127 RepID=A0A6A6BJT3_9PEZI|nr:uncharacterized protein K452DRAFT_307241 [Aplosporella prunicola CBS 121167]KAF2143888.1 hypothetical protein K452DRAFT_307241 [Aplosporella prunicola CBS 121167]
MPRRALDKMTPLRKKQTLRKRASIRHESTPEEDFEEEFGAYIRRVDLQQNSQLASFRLERGDVILRLSHRADDTLLVHSEVLRQFPYFNATLSGRWGEPMAQLTLPTEASTMNVWQYSLIITKERPIVFFLQCHTESPVEIEVHRHPRLRYDDDLYPVDFLFYMSEYAIGYFEREHPNGQKQHLGSLQIQAINAHKMLLRLLYGLYVDMDSVYTPGIAIEIFADVVAYSEFYGMLDVVAPAITEVLLNTHGLWKDVAEEPLFHLTLAAKLHCECLYDDALKHLISIDKMWPLEPNNALSHHFGSFSGHLNYDVFDFKRMEKYFLKKKLDLQNNMRRYIDDLRSIGSTIKPPFPAYDNWNTEITKSLRKRDGKCRWVARSIYNEWFVRNFSYWGGDDERFNEHFKAACEQIIKYGSQVPPDITIFGNREYLMLLGQHDCPINHRRDPFLCLKQELTRLLLQAAEVVESTIPYRNYFQHSAHYETKYFTGFSHWDKDHYYPWKRPFTGLETDEDQQYSYEWDMAETQKENSKFRSVLDTVQIKSASLEWTRFVSVPEVAGNELILSAHNSLGLVTLELDHGDGLLP